MKRPDATRVERKSQILAKSSLFADLNPEATAALAALFSTCHYDADQVIFLEGELASSFHLVAQGKIKVVQTSAEGHEVLLHVFEPGGVIGALPTIGEGTYPASAISLEPALTYSISAADFREFMETHPTVMSGLLRFATRMLQSSHRRLREMATERVERRIARSLARLANQLGQVHGESILIGAPLTHQDLADMCGTTAFTISRTLKEWERQAIVSTGRKQIAILQPHALIAIAEDLPAKPGEANSPE